MNKKKFKSCNKVLWAEKSLKQLLLQAVKTTPGFQISLTFGYASEALFFLLHIFYVQTHKHNIYTNLHMLTADDWQDFEKKIQTKL